MTSQILTFDINLIEGLNLIENNYNQYIDKINQLSEKYKM